MIIVKLKGGLGNQLFQYATGRALSLRQSKNNNNKTSLKLDLTWLDKKNGNDTVRYYSMSPFNIGADIATTEEIYRVSNNSIISKFLRFVRTKIFRQFYVSFTSRIFNLQGDCYLDGFFQTEKYFIDKENMIRNDLRLKLPLGEKVQEIYSKLQNDINSVSMHVRRGDVARNSKTNPYYGICTQQYYENSISYILKKIDPPHLYIFSDDIEWVKTNMPLKYPATYVSSPEIPDYEELILMSECKHNIIANSSFSWWGAWLNENPSKIVIAPKRWIKGNDIDYKDICPTSWIRI